MHEQSPPHQRAHGRGARREVDKSPGKTRGFQPCGHVTEAHGFCFASDPRNLPLSKVQIGQGAAGAHRLLQVRTKVLNDEL